MSTVAELVKQSPMAARVLITLVMHMGRKTNAVYTTQKTLAELHGVSRVTISKAIAVLKEKNFIRVRRIEGGFVYCVNADAFWQAEGNRKSEAYFNMRINDVSKSRYPSLVGQHVPTLRLKKTGTPDVPTLEARSGMLQ